MSTEKKIVNLSEALNIIQKWKSDEEKVVFTNGCFDIMHLGHIDYLEKAKRLGSKMVVGLNSDDSVRILKGSLRPIVPEYARARMLAALSFVDAVILFDEQTPYNLIKALLPDILVKGDDYTIDKIVGSDVVISNGGKVETIGLVDGFSTSNIIKKIKEIS